MSAFPGPPPSPPMIRHPSPCLLQMAALLDDFSGFRLENGGNTGADTQEAASPAWTGKARGQPIGTESRNPLPSVRNLHFSEQQGRIFAVFRLRPLGRLRLKTSEFSTMSVWLLGCIGPALIGRRRAKPLPLASLIPRTRGAVLRSSAPACSCGADETAAARRPRVKHAAQ